MDQPLMDLLLVEPGIERDDVTRTSAVPPGLGTG